MHEAGKLRLRLATQNIFKILPARVARGAGGGGALLEHLGSSSEHRKAVEGKRRVLGQEIRLKIIAQRCSSGRDRHPLELTAFGEPNSVGCQLDRLFTLAL